MTGAPFHRARQMLEPPVWASMQITSGLCKEVNHSTKLFNLILVLFGSLQAIHQPIRNPIWTAAI